MGLLLIARSREALTIDGWVCRWWVLLRGFLYAVQGVLEAEVRAIYGRVYIVTLVVRGNNQAAWASHASCQHLGTRLIPTLHSSDESSTELNN